ncbi:MAG: hypothetical protein KDA24_14985 [Deltaproteobacteria bacterium]|nr:hypothetical protein [Deltaproteobacteria bacterium]
MTRLLRPRTTDPRSGNAMLEYVILLVAIAVFVLALVVEYGRSVQDEFTGADDNAAWDQIAANLEGDGTDPSDTPCPYYYNPATGRWHDPATHLFVSFDNASGNGCS